jgi:hypothetical protein
VKPTPDSAREELTRREHVKKYGAAGNDDGDQSLEQEARAQVNTE